LTDVYGSLKLLQQILLEGPQSYSYFPKCSGILARQTKREYVHKFNSIGSLKQQISQPRRILPNELAVNDNSDCDTSCYAC